MVASMARSTGRNRARAAAPLALILAFALLPTTASAESYRLQTGDVLELRVAGRADIRENMPVNIDGEIVVPLAGVIPAAGRALNDISDEIRQRIAMTALPAANDRGLSTAEHIHPSLVSVSLREYRPVYVDGAVRRPGAHEFLPGLTVRQVIALAGGTSPVEDFEDPALRMIALRSQLEDLRARALASQAKIDRLRAEIEEAAAPAPSPARSAPSDRNEADWQEAGRNGAGGNETEYETGPAILEGLTGSVRRERVRADFAYFDAAASLAASEHAALTRQLAAEADGAEADAEEFARLSDAARGGTITAARLANSRRGLLFARSSQWETQARLASVEREQEFIGNQRAQRGLKAREEAVEALGAEIMTLTAIRAELGAAHKTLAYLSDYASETPGARPAKIEVSRGAGPATAVPPGEDPVLRPGDLIHVTLDLATR